MTKPRMYQAKCGRRRFYLSQDDADAYDRGYCAYPGLVDAPLMTPARTGYYDAEQHDTDERDFAAEQAAYLVEREERLNGTP